MFVPRISLDRNDPRHNSSSTKVLHAKTIGQNPGRARSASHDISVWEGMPETIPAKFSISLFGLETPDFSNDEKADTSTSAQNPKQARYSVLVVAFAAISLLFFYTINYSFTGHQRDTAGCRMSYMSPSYIHLKGFDTEHTRFASKYALYLYREQSIDTSEEPRGIPVLFIPGNAGSYKQVRPLAAEAAHQFSKLNKSQPAMLKSGVRNLDFFTVDFKEDFSAFHGRTLLDQAEYLNDAITYILLLYHDSRRSEWDVNLPDPSSVIVIGHSMGGLVARALLTMPNYQANTINTIITMSTPHSLPPAPFDWEIQRIYQHINEYWRKSHAAKWANNNPLWHVTLISIAGGGLDTVVSSDHASVSRLVPATHGFTVFTSSIPKVWTGMDHQAIMWCDQFRKVVASSLLEIVDVRRAGQTKPRADRMSIFRRWYLTGLEENSERRFLHSVKGPVELSLEEYSHEVLTLNQRLVLHPFTSSIGKIHLMPVPPIGSLHGTGEFQLLTNEHIVQSGNMNGIHVMFCTVLPFDGSRSPLPILLKGSTKDDTAPLACKDASSDVIYIPASTTDHKSPYSESPFNYLSFLLDMVTAYQYVAIIDRSTQQKSRFVLAEFFEKAKAVTFINSTLISLLSNGAEMTLGHGRAITHDIRLPAVKSSLLAYKLKVLGGRTGNHELLPPLVRQYISDPHETKFHVNVGEADINIHSGSPFLEPIQEHDITKALSLQVWSDPTCHSPITVSLRFDPFGSIGKLVMRYRVAFVAFPFIIVSLTLRKQFHAYDIGHPFMNFKEGLALVIAEDLRQLLTWTSLGSLLLILFRDSGAQFPPTAFEITPAPESFADILYHLWMSNDILLGLREPFFWFLAPLFLLLSIGVSAIIYYCTSLTIFLASLLYSVTLYNSKKWQKISDRQVSTLLIGSNGFEDLTHRLILLALVATVVPFQFAYIIGSFVQLITCVKAFQQVREQGYPQKSVDFFNYAQSILILMIFLLPINLPILVVWVRNLAVQWLTPFSSHHNVLSVAPILLMIEAMVSGHIIPRMDNRFRIITSVILLLLAIYAALYGVMYTYFLHYLVNIFATWLVVVQLINTHSSRGLPNTILQAFGHESKRRLPPISTQTKNASSSSR
ncbi:GPI inositol-deacylase [Neolecta irregularis DAH-3]|uniref:GPI inositol-deacylase n=1 Tax=Neolecta irregularis (strain DAH-3) TaxID=1198029 RepID=A0A1U7LNY1_NEOID|nr:GPI inositol-deacylase [Neolecta irregularis DAH-3]|eukprot:OLL24252.1 GPI inositol-deacylase [Neolecta irregularis DAH-3]